MLSRRTTLALPLLTLLLLPTGCDNVARAFDPDGGQKKGDDDGTLVQQPVIGGISIDGRPKVASAYPKGAGWPGTVPIVVVFNESVNEDSISPPSNTGGQPTVYVRAQGTTSPLPASYDFLLGGTVVLIRPSAPLNTGSGGGGGGGVPPTTPVFEIVVDPEARDADGVRFGGTEPRVVAEFTADQDPNLADGQILTTLPENNARNQQRETPIYAVFSKPPVATTVTDTSYHVREANGAPLPGAISFPLRVSNVPDPRIARIDPDARLDGNVKHELVFTDAIEFGTTGKLDFGGKTPFSSFTTLWQAAPAAPTVGNASSGFPDKVNRTNLGTMVVHVDLDASAAAGDDLIVRLYGLEPKTKADTDVEFVERRQKLPVPGPGTFMVDFTSALGTLEQPRFSDGAITLAATLARGAARTGYVLSDSDNEPRLDISAPTIRTIGPPAGSTPDSIVTDQEHIVFHGVASEQLAEARFDTTMGSSFLFASSADGQFTMLPQALGRLTAPAQFQFEYTDVAGNPAVAPVMGFIEQRGAVTNSVSPSGTLIVEAYDEATFAPVAGATVLIEPGMPAKPATGRQSAVTGANGRVTFTGLATTSHSITIVRDGFHLRSLLDTGAGFVSLPLRPQTNATATLTGSLAFVPSAGQTARIASNLFDEPALLDVAPSGTTPTAIPATAIRPGRLQVVTAFAGTIEPIATPTFANYHCSVCGNNGSTPTPPLPPATGGQTVTRTLPLIPSTGTALNLAGAFMLDFAGAGGLDTANLAGRPTVRIVSSLQGIPGMTMLGLGFATPASGVAFAIQGSYSLPSVLAVAGFSPALWVSTQAVDRDGNLSRQRQLIADYTLGTTFPTVPPLGVPTVTAPSGPSTGSPSVTFEDRLDPAALPGGRGFLELRAQDALGRQWSLLRADTDALAAETWQLPDLAGTGLVGLSTGTWTIGADMHLLFSITYGPNDYMLEEMRRQQVAFTRAAPKSFTIN